MLMVWTLSWFPISSIIGKMLLSFVQKIQFCLKQRKDSQNGLLKATSLQLQVSKASSAPPFSREGINYTWMELLLPHVFKCLLEIILSDFFKSKLG